MYILARNMESREEAGGFLIKMPYNDFNFVEIMSDNRESEVFVIHLKQKLPIIHGVPWKYIFASARDWLIGQIRICWKTDYMYQTPKGRRTGNQNDTGRLASKTRL